MRYFIIALLLGGLAIAASAAPSQEQKIAHIEKALNISADQAAKVVQILDQQRGKFQALRDKSGDEMPPCEQMRDLKKDTDAQLATVLTADQIKKLREMRFRHFRHRGQRQGQDAPPPDGPGGPGAAL